MKAGEGTEWAWRAAKDRAITLRFDRPQGQVTAWLQQAVDAARRSGDSRMLADVLWDMAPLQLMQGHLGGGGGGGAGGGGARPAQAARGAGRGGR